MSRVGSRLPFLPLVWEQETTEGSAREGPPESPCGSVLNKLGEWRVSCCPASFYLPLLIRAWGRCLDPVPVQSRPGLGPRAGPLPHWGRAGPSWETEHLDRSGS